MLGLAFALGLFSYSIFYFGLDQIRGGNNGYWDMVKPGGYKNVAPDSAANAGQAQQKAGSGGAPKSSPAASKVVAPGLTPQQQAAAANAAAGGAFIVPSVP